MISFCFILTGRSGHLSRSRTYQSRSHDLASTFPSVSYTTGLGILTRSLGHLSRSKCHQSRSHDLVSSFCLVYNDNKSLFAQIVQLHLTREKRKEKKKNKKEKRHTQVERCYNYNQATVTIKLYTCTIWRPLLFYMPREVMLLISKHVILLISIDVLIGVFISSFKIALLNQTIWIFWLIKFILIKFRKLWKPDHE